MSYAHRLAIGRLSGTPLTEEIVPFFLSEVWAGRQAAEAIVPQQRPESLGFLSTRSHPSPIPDPEHGHQQTCRRPSTR